MKILHIITGLGCGGAEGMLLKLCAQLVQRNHKVAVVSLGGLDFYGENLAALGVEVIPLSLNRSNVLQQFNVLRKYIKNFHPDVVQTWMYHADLFGGLAARAAGCKNIIWGIRQSNLDPTYSKWTTRFIARLNALFSYLVPRQIVACAEVAANVHLDLGYQRKKMRVIPNGFELTKWYHDAQLGAAKRQELGISNDALVVGITARFDPQKGYDILVEAAKQVISELPRTHFICCGDKIDGKNAELNAWLETHGLKANFSLLGRRSDLVAIYNAMDVSVSSSRYGEGFSNSIGEAMACGIPCVVTDIGDSAFIVGNAGVVVEPHNSVALAKGLLQILKIDQHARHELGQQALARVQHNFDINRITERFEDTYRELIQ